MKSPASWPYPWSTNQTRRGASVRAAERVVARGPLNAQVVRVGCRAIESSVTPRNSTALGVTSAT